MTMECRRNWRRVTPCVDIAGTEKNSASMARVFDLVMTHKLDADDFFIHRVQQECARRGLNFFLIEPLWVERFHELLLTDQLWARVLLNMHSEHHDADDIYHRLIRLADARGVQVIDPPDVALGAFDKAALHPRLVAAGLPVPETIIVGPERAGTLELTAAERELLGTPFVIKPSLGYGRRGLVLEGTGAADLEKSRAEWPDPRHLLQRRVVPRMLGSDPGYFRVYHVFGDLWLCWWNCYTDEYRLVTAAEREEFGLEALEILVCRVAELTGMRFFSSEIAAADTGEFVLIDYVNDQCHLLTQSASPQNGVPDELVAAIAGRLVAGAVGLIPTKP